MPRRPPPAAAGVLLPALVALVVLATAAGGPWRGHVQLPGLPPPRVPVPHPPPPRPLPRGSSSRDPSGLPLGPVWLAVLAGVVVVLIAVAVVLLRAATRVRARLPLPAPLAEELPGQALGTRQVADAVEAAERAVAGARVPRDAVIGAWVALEQAAAESGVPRVESATPTEFALDVLDRTGADAAATRGLLALYQRARFSSEPVTEEGVSAARAFLDELRRGLAEVPA
ncbi:uncharacterized protein DUF4129 [Motilibacter rhizosphaerae]|uniref:Uncharacterized protein DUF4129 n=1 Tax=Motilibacter rhizosphaerae TaxID=598652 RepID=A0A4Q7NWB1_9ACTN|nr:DUF4129 domain-containing protein [Motilibacter rhizosphaerae]RZS91497.1 uncharacterized protein DUF4129 [Motilibacter rhizosphaerae]